MVDGTDHVKIRKIKDYAKENKIPIMQEEGIDFLTTFIIKYQIKEVLEIGTAIGYSAIMMALVNPKLKIISVERDRERYLEAIKNVKKFNLEDRITLYFKDAFDFSTNIKFDLVFIDAAKGQNIRFFEKFEKNVKDDGYIITDNMYFHGLVNKELDSIKSKDLRGLVKKIKLYHEFLKQNINFSTTIYNVGDGIAVSKKR